MVAVPMPAEQVTPAVTRPVPTCKAAASTVALATALVQPARLAALENAITCAQAASTVDTAGGLVARGRLAALACVWAQPHYLWLQ